MLDHIGLMTNDLDASVAFYTKALKCLGYYLNVKDHNSAGFGPDNTSIFWLYAVNKIQSSSTHLAFCAKNRKAVDMFHSTGIQAGGRDNGPPGLRTEYSLNYYAAFLLDLDGNNIEAVYEI